MYENHRSDEVGLGRSLYERLEVRRPKSALSGLIFTKNLLHIGLNQFRSISSCFQEGLVTPLLILGNMNLI